jgi:hypothetical protein
MPSLGESKSNILDPNSVLLTDKFMIYQNKVLGKIYEPLPKLG